MKGAKLLDGTIRTQDVRAQINGFLISEQLLKTEDKRASHVFRSGLQEWLVGLVASGSAFQIDTRNNAVWTRDYGSRQYLVLIDRLCELGYLSGQPLTGNTLTLTDRAGPLKRILQRYIQDQRQ